MHVNVRIEPRWTLHRGAARRARVLARDRAARAGARDLEVVEGGAPRRLPRLQPERQGPHHLLGLLGAPAARRARLGAARLGRGARLRAGRLHRADDAGALRGARRSARRHGRGARARSTRCSSSPRATRRRASATRRGRRTSARWRARRRASRRRARRRAAEEAPRAKMPLHRRRELARARTPRSPASSAGRRGIPRRPQHLAVDDVLVDSMRGRSSTWTRIRVNLRHVPEALRPPQETPDPDDDPTREWRETWQACKKRARVSASAARCAKIVGQLVRRDDLELRVGAVARLLVGAPAAELRGVAEAACPACGRRRPRRRARGAAAPRRDPCPGSSGSWRPGMRCAVGVAASAAGPVLPRMARRARPRGRARGTSTSSRRFASVKLAHTPTCCSAPASS